MKSAGDSMKAAAPAPAPSGDAMKASAPAAPVDAAKK
jgi:hypothetical protein